MASRRLPACKRGRTPPQRSLPTIDHDSRRSDGKAGHELQGYLQFHEKLRQRIHAPSLLSCADALVDLDQAPHGGTLLWLGHGTCKQLETVSRALSRMRAAKLIEVHNRLIRTDTERLKALARRCANTT